MLRFRVVVCIACAVLVANAALALRPEGAPVILTRNVTFVTDAGETVLLTEGNYYVRVGRGAAAGRLARVRGARLLARRGGRPAHREARRAVRRGDLQRRGRAPRGPAASRWPLDRRDRQLQRRGDARRVAARRAERGQLPRGVGAVAAAGRHRAVRARSAARAPSARNRRVERGLPPRPGDREVQGGCRGPRARGGDAVGRAAEPQPRRNAPAKDGARGAPPARVAHPAAGRRRPRRSQPDPRRRVGRGVDTARRPARAVHGGGAPRRRAAQLVRARRPWQRLRDQAARQRRRDRDREPAQRARLRRDRVSRADPAGRRHPAADAGLAGQPGVSRGLSPRASTRSTRGRGPAARVSACGSWTWSRAGSSTTRTCPRATPP